MNNLKDLIKKGINSECIEKGILRENECKIYSDIEVKTNNEVLRWLIRNCDKRTLERISGQVLNNIWSDICTEIIRQHKQYFKEYFSSKQDVIRRMLVESIYNIFIEINSSEEYKYMEFRGLDIEILPNGTNLITNNWRNRNLYSSIKELLPDVAGAIITEAKAIYKEYLKDLEGIDTDTDDLLSKFKRLRTHKGRMKFLERKIWLEERIIKVNGQEKFDINNLIYISKDIISILDYALYIKDFIVAIDILDIVLFIIGNCEEDNELICEVSMMKEKTVNGIKSFLYNKQVKQIYDILINL